MHIVYHTTKVFFIYFFYSVTDFPIDLCLKELPTYIERPMLLVNQ